MARYVVHLGFKPWEYWRLTVPERNAITDAWNKANKH